MTMQDDLAYIRDMAEAGARAPSLGGRFSVWWGGLSTVALLAHWATLSGLGPIEAQQIGLIWLAFGIVGGLGSALLARSLRDKPGQASAGNRAESAVWPVSTVLIFSIAISIGIATLVKGVNEYAFGNFQLFDFILPLVFSLHATNYAASAALFGTRLPRWAVGFSIFFAVATTLLIGNPLTYLYAAAGSVLVVLGPGLATLRAEPGEVV